MPHRRRTLLAFALVWAPALALAEAPAPAAPDPEAASLAAWGAFKKVCLADTIAPYIDKVFIVEDPSGPLVWSAAIAFSVQIYADFSGYTDIARGVARMLGFDLLENFKSPYLAATTPEFWQRWHISLSFWIRDYLMVPLLGAASRLTLFRFVWATILTFVIIGFWHGASWNFILFGFCASALVLCYTLVPIPDTAMLFLGFPLGFFLSGVFSGMGAFLSELFPSRVRGSAQGFCYNFGRATGAVCPALVGYLSGSLTLGVAIGVVAACAYCLVILAALLLPETAGRELDTQVEASAEPAPAAAA